MTSALVLAIVGSTLSQAGSGHTIGNGTGITYRQGDWPTSETGTITDATSTADFYTPNIGGGVDNLFQNIWAFRIRGVDTRERLFANVNQRVANASSLSSLFTVTGPGGISGTILLVQYTHGGQNFGGSLEQAVYVQNTGAVAFTLDIFNYLDIDPNGSTNHNTASIFGGWSMSNGPITMVASGFGGSQTEVDPYGGSDWVRDKLNDNVATTLDGTGLPMTGNFTGAFQWTVPVPVVNPPPRRALTSSFGLNAPALPSTGTGVVVLAACAAGATKRRRSCC